MGRSSVSTGICFLSPHSGGPEEESQRRRIVFSIMRYLQDQLKSGRHSEDSVESLEGRNIE